MLSKSKGSIYSLTISALLCAIGIIIPLFSPFKIVLEPASFTLASHVAIFIAMFISPVTAASVAFGTTVGFFLGGFPIVVVIRAASHMFFALCGAFFLKSKPALLYDRIPAFLFSFLIGLLHAVGEIAVVTPFYFQNLMTPGYYAKGFVFSVVLLVGVGTVIHSMIDFEISLFIWKLIERSVKRSTR